MKGILFFTILFFGFKSFAQYPIIAEAEKKQGVYRNYEEFKNNRPSLKLDYPIISKQIDFSEVSSIKAYALDIPKKESREIGGVFGFCDGKRIFMVSTEGPILPNDLHKFVFYKVEYLGKYVVFDAVQNNTDFTMDREKGFETNGVLKMEGKNQTKKTVFFNFETGQLKTLTKNSLKELLSDRPEMLEKFKKQDNKNEYLKKYLIDYLKS